VRERREKRLLIPRRNGRASLAKTFDVLISSYTPALRAERQSYLRETWLRELAEAQRWAKVNHRLFLTFRFLAVAGALVLPALASQNLGGVPSTPVRVATLGASLVVSAAAAANQVYRFSNEWLSNYEYARALESEGWAFLQSAGPYKGVSDAEELFFERVEQLRHLHTARRAEEIRAMASETSERPGEAPKLGGRATRRSRHHQGGAQR
jgi:hypothetical protein